MAIDATTRPLTERNGPTTGMLRRGRARRPRGQCEACGHDWSEHLRERPDTSECSECTYKIIHEEPAA